eukprot:s489_g12.t1
MRVEQLRGSRHGLTAEGKLPLSGAPGASMICWCRRIPCRSCSWHCGVMPQSWVPCTAERPCTALPRRRMERPGSTPPALCNSSRRSQQRSTRRRLHGTWRMRLGPWAPRRCSTDRWPWPPNEAATHR